MAIPEIIHCGEHRGIKQLAEAIPEAFYGDPAARDAKLHALAGLLVIRLSEYADTTPDGRRSVPAPSISAPTSTSP